MATITIENVPESTVQQIGDRVDFCDIKISKKRWARKDPTIRLQKLVDDPENTSYGPFSPDDFLAKMKTW